MPRHHLPLATILAGTPWQSALRGNALQSHAAGVRETPNLLFVAPTSHWVTGWIGYPPLLGNLQNQWVKIRMYSWENHRIEWWIFQQANHPKLDLLQILPTNAGNQNIKPFSVVVRWTSNCHEEFLISGLSFPHIFSLIPGPFIQGKDSGQWTSFLHECLMSKNWVPSLSGSLSHSILIKSECAPASDAYSPSTMA